MKEKKFTPGPWFSDGSNGDMYPCISDDSGSGNLVAQTFCCSDREDFTAKEAEANANLIAAAPELLDILERLVMYYDHGELPPEAEFKMVEARRVIKKVYGE